MQWLQTGDIPMRWPAGQLEAHQTDTFEALEHPAHHRAICKLLQLVRDGLARGGQLRAQPMLSKPIHQQAQYHHQTKRDDALGLFHEHRRGQKQQILEKGEPAFDATLVFVGLDELMVGKLARVDDTGRNGKDGWRWTAWVTARASTTTVAVICQAVRSGGASLRGRPRWRCLGRATRRACTASHSGHFLSRRVSAAWASGSQAKRWVLRCHRAFSHCWRVLSICRSSDARARSSPWVVRTTTQRSPAGACGAVAQKREPS